MTVKGMADIMPDENLKLEKIRAEFLQAARRFGYKFIETPIVEHSDLFIRGIGDDTDIVEKQMYLFNDKKGNQLALRPEGTASVVRSFIEHKLNSDAVHKFCYYGPMYRYERPQKGRMRQFHQAGIELFGIDDPAADAEQIGLASIILDNLGVKKRDILINSIGCEICRSSWRDALISYFSSFKEELCGDCRRRLETNPLRILDCKLPGCNEISKNAPANQDYLCDNCKKHHDGLRSYLDELCIKYTDDPQLVRGLDYYTKTVFEIVTGDIGAQSAIIAGGRYNNLVKSLGGHDTAGTGWAMGIERLALISNIKTGISVDAYFIPLDKISKKLLLKLYYETAKIRECYFDYKGGSLKAQLRHANGMNAQYCVIMGANERDSSKLLIKDMKNKTQKIIKSDELKEVL